jgi:hypothetical protein
MSFFDLMETSWSISWSERGYSQPPAVVNKSSEGPLRPA